MSVINCNAEHNMKDLLQRIIRSEEEQGSPMEWSEEHKGWVRRVLRMVSSEADGSRDYRNLMSPGVESLYLASEKAQSKIYEGGDYFAALYVLKANVAMPEDEAAARLVSESMKALKESLEWLRAQRGSHAYNLHIDSSRLERAAELVSDAHCIIDGINMNIEGELK